MLVLKPKTAEGNTIVPDEEVRTTSSCYGAVHNKASRATVLIMTCKRHAMVCTEIEIDLRNNNSK